MSGLVEKIPFFRLLLPAVTSLTVSAFLVELPFPLLGCIVGAGVVAISLLLPEKRQFACRWLFGGGLFVLIFFLFAMLFRQKEMESAYAFSDTPLACIATVTDFPEEKLRTYACNVRIGYPLQRRIVVYLQKDERAMSIGPGDEIWFVAPIRPFRNFGNPDDFNYARFMRNNGFSGHAFLSSTNWHVTGKKHFSFYIAAQKVRSRVLRFYRQLELDRDARSFVSALTLGYKQELTNELKEAFRASGTSHVLAVSGLHVGIVYGVFAFLFSFLGKSGARAVLKQLLIVVALWFYAFLTGLSPSVLRATLMLTIASIGWAAGKKGFTLNSLGAAAFLILFFDPMSLFNVGFQLSFAAVLAILLYKPVMDRLFRPRGSIGKFGWGLLSVSISAQAGVFPIVLYYFGTFPTYFFIANMVVVPLTGIAIYATVPILLLEGMRPHFHIVADGLYPVCEWGLKMVVHLVLKVVYLVESLPYAELAVKQLSALQAFLLSLMVFFTFRFFGCRKAGSLISGLTCSLLLMLTLTFSNLYRDQMQLAVFNRTGFSDISLYGRGRRIYFEVEENGFIPHPTKKIVRLSENRYMGAKSDRPMEIDLLILSRDSTFSINQLSAIFSADKIVLDSSLPPHCRSRLVEECKKLGISFHDVGQDGAYFINL